jgi:hypothetical protein
MEREATVYFQKGNSSQDGSLNTINISHDRLPRNEMVSIEDRSHKEEFSMEG